MNGPAAEMYERSGNYQQAAEFFLSVENFDKAATNFERSVNNFLAGKLYFRMNKMNKSLQLLQKVQKSEAEYFEAVRLIGEILAANGYVDLAIKKYLEVVQSSEVSADTAPVYYNLARTLEDKGQAAEALNIYQRIAAWDFEYSDVKARSQALQSGGRVQPKAQPVAPVNGGDEDVPSVLGTATPSAAPQQVVSMMDGFEFLKGTPLFRDLSLDEMKVFYNSCETRKFRPNETMIEQDQPGQALFVLRKGTARVVKVTPEEEDTVARLGAGSPAGEMALIDDAPTSARVVAESEVEAFVMTRDRFEKILASNDKTAIKLYRFFVSTLSKRLRTTSENLARAVAGQVRSHG
jgi:tetratricopeptide (TPR) repeat protein